MGRSDPTCIFLAHVMFEVTMTSEPRNSRGGLRKCVYFIGFGNL